MPTRHLDSIGFRSSSLPPPAELHGYPRPLLRRHEWLSLNGPWEFALDPDGTVVNREQVVFDRTIEVPFSPETRQSGIADTDLYKACWYRRRFEVPAFPPDQRLLLHFGAVDY